ncbi:MAG: EAL domain-containing protein [Gammaproteobacteria bacterium]|nr:EAL domain-containing protein [Gammaproteobacteria bacterium]
MTAPSDAGDRRYPRPEGSDDFRQPDDSSLHSRLLEMSSRLEALEAENHLLRTLVDTHPDILFIKDAKGLFRYANRTLTDFYGTSREDIVGRDDSHYTGNTEQSHFFRRSVEQVLSRFERETVFEDATDGTTGEVNHFRSIKQPFHDIHGQPLVAVLAHNITTEVREHERKTRQIDHIYDTSLEGFWDWNILTSSVTHNRRWSQILGIPESELSNSLEEFASLLHPEDKPEAMIAIQDCMAGKTAYYHRHRMLTRGGDVVWVIDKGDVIERDSEGNPLRMIGSITDITRIVESEALLHQHSRFDSLTKLANRATLIDSLQQAIIITDARDTHGALIFIDLDHFKKINDLLGHTTGDHLLIEVAHRLSSTVRDSDLVARFGGDEFVILVQPLSHDPQIACRELDELMERLQQALNQPYSLLGPQSQPLQHHSSASLGSIMFHDRHLSAEELIRRADIAMYRAKEAGRNQTVRFDPSMRVELERAVQLENDLRRAIENEELYVELQPQFDRGLKLVGAECLLRWRHAKLGNISPYEFIPLAEKSQLIDSLGDWVLEQACKLLEDWQKGTAFARIYLSVNVSVKQLDSPHYVGNVAKALSQHTLDPQYLQLELTENVFATDMPATVARMHELRSLGLRLSLDDFGTGFSSLTYIKHLPFDELKVDRSFVNDLENDEMNRRMVNFMVQLGRELGMCVVAEGVETPRQRELLLEMGCDALQGYLMDKPMAIEAFTAKYQLG